jgi:hypothetical protein
MGITKTAAKSVYRSEFSLLPSMYTHHHSYWRATNLKVAKNNKRGRSTA